MTTSPTETDRDDTGARISAEFVQRWSELYPTEKDRPLFEQVGPAVVARGYYSRDDFLAVGRWKSARSLSYLERNSDNDIKDVTRMALAAPERLRYRILGVLHGVGEKMASALLTVPYPEQFTVADYRAIETLRAHGELDGQPSDYVAYLRLCRELASRVGTDLRTLDRALWQWSKARAAARRSRTS